VCVCVRACVHAHVCVCAWVYMRAHARMFIPTHICLSSTWCTNQNW